MECSVNFLYRLYKEKTYYTQIVLISARYRLTHNTGIETCLYRWFQMLHSGAFIQFLFDYLFFGFFEKPKKKSSCSFHAKTPVLDYSWAISQGCFSLSKNFKICIIGQMRLPQNFLFNCFPHSTLPFFMFLWKVPLEFWQWLHWISRLLWIVWTLVVFPIREHRISFMPSI